MKRGAGENGIKGKWWIVGFISQTHRDVLHASPPFGVQFSPPSSSHASKSIRIWSRICRENGSSPHGHMAVMFMIIITMTTKVALFYSQSRWYRVVPLTAMFGPRLPWCSITDALLWSHCFSQSPGTLHSSHLCSATARLQAAPVASGNEQAVSFMSLRKQMRKSTTE